MDRLYPDELIFENNSAPDLNESNLNRMSHALAQIDERVAEGYAGAIEASLLVDKMTQIKNETIVEANQILADTTAKKDEVVAAATEAITAITTAKTDAINGLDAAAEQAEADIGTLKTETITEVNQIVTDVEDNLQQSIAARDATLEYKTDAENAAALARETAENIGSIIVPKGSVLFENLPALSTMSVGDMYNILNDFVTTSDFIIGAGFPYPLGTNVYKTQGGLLDVFAGAVRVDNDTIKYNANGQLTLGLDNAESEGF